MVINQNEDKFCLKQNNNVLQNNLFSQWDWNYLNNRRTRNNIIFKTLNFVFSILVIMIVPYFIVSAYVFYTKCSNTESLYPLLSTQTTYHHWK